MGEYQHVMKDAITIMRNLGERPNADISQKSLMILDVIYPEAMHYRLIAEIIGSADETSVSAAMTTWCAYGMVERPGNRDGIYRSARPRLGV